MERNRQLNNRSYQKSNCRSGNRQGMSYGNRSAWEDNGVDFKCNCSCECSVEDVLADQTCSVPSDCPAIAMDPLTGFPLAMAYVPWQKSKEMYCVKEAMYHGTIFPELDLGFYGKRC